MCGRLGGHTTMIIRPLTAGGVLLLVGVVLAAASGAMGPTSAGPTAQEPPSRRDIAITAKDYRFSPDRLDVTQDELVRLTVRSDDVAYSFNIDEYRVSRRIPAGGSVTVEFHADRPGTFPFYSNLTTDPRHAQARGQIVVRAH